MRGVFSDGVLVKEKNNLVFLNEDVLTMLTKKKIKRTSSSLPFASFQQNKRRKRIHESLDKCIDVAYKQTKDDKDTGNTRDDKDTGSARDVDEKGEKRGKEEEEKEEEKEEEENTEPIDDVMTVVEHSKMSHLTTETI